LSVLTSSSGSVISPRLSANGSIKSYVTRGV
jgi:hypothetical protein